MRRRVHDTHFHGYRHHVVPLRSPRATYRVFVAEDGTRRAALFRPGMSRELTAEVLAAKLRGAEYMAKEKHRPSNDASGRPGG